MSKDTNNTPEATATNDKVKTPALPAWQCEVQKFDNPPAIAIEELYVGDKYLLHCHGAFVEELSNKLSIEAKNQEQSYGIHILQFRTVENDGFWAEATSYRPGALQLNQFQLVEGDRVIPIEGGELKIQSVMEQKSAEELNHPEAMKMKMLGPFSLAMPWWYWALWIAAVVLILSLALRWILKKVRRKKLLDRLSRQATALTPYNQFNKEVREHMRQFTSGEDVQRSSPQYMKALDESFRMYLLRELLVPANEWSVRAVMAEIKSRHKKIYKFIGPQIRRVLVEFDRATKDMNSVKFEDCEQLRFMSRRVADNLYRAKRLQK